MQEPNQHSTLTFQAQRGVPARIQENQGTPDVRHFENTTWWSLFLKYSVEVVRKLAIRMSSQAQVKSGLKKKVISQIINEDDDGKEAKLREIEEIQTAAKKSGEEWSKLVLKKQQQGLIPVLTATVLDLFRKERDGVDGNISTESWMMMYPGALDPDKNYLKDYEKKKGEATKLIREDIAKWKQNNVTFNDMLNAVIDIEHRIEAKVDKKVGAAEKRLTERIEVLEQAVIDLRAENKEKSREIAVLSYVHREILISGEDWSEFEDDFNKLKAKAEEFLGQFSTNLGDDFVRSVSRVQTTDPDTGVINEYFRYRILVANETQQSIICDAAKKDRRFRHKVKPGKTRSKRQVSSKNWPFTCASHQFNYLSMLAYQEQMEEPDPDISKIDLVRIEKKEDGTGFRLVRYACTNLKVGNWYDKLKKGVLEPHPQYKESKHKTHIPLERSS